MYARLCIKFGDGLVMAKTQIDIDEALLAQTAEILGTTTKRATVEAALRATTATRARQQLAELIAASGQTPEELDLLGRIRGTSWLPPRHVGYGSADAGRRP